MCLNSRYIFDLQHYKTHDGGGLTLHALPMMRSKWDRITLIETMGVRTTLKFIETVEESYGLLHQQATRDVEFWALDRQL
jgi:hypothetical protein